MSIRFLIIYSALTLVAVLFAAIITGPIWGLRLDTVKGEQFQILNMLLPTFVAYLSGAVVYATSHRTIREPKGERGRILRVITIGGLLIFTGGIILSTAVFYWSGNGKLGENTFSFSQFSSAIAVLLSILTATTSAVAAFVFGSQTEEQDDEKN